LQEVAGFYCKILLVFIAGSCWLFLLKDIAGFYCKILRFFIARYCWDLFQDVAGFYCWLFILQDIAGFYCCFCCWFLLQDIAGFLDNNGQPRHRPSPLPPVRNSLWAATSDVALLDCMWWCLCSLLSLCSC
jgi:hypothetical protein